VQDGDLCRLQMQQWLRSNFSYTSMQGNNAPHDIGFRGSKSMMRVLTTADSSEKLIVNLRLTKAHAQLLKETPGATDTFLEVCALAALAARRSHRLSLFARSSATFRAAANSLSP
jgi:hypothetical protein